MSKKNPANAPIAQPDQKHGAKIVSREDRGRVEGGVKVLSTTNTKNPDLTKGVHVKAGNRGHA